MKTTIQIKGQIFGNSTLANKIIAKGRNIISSGDGHFYSKWVIFGTKKDARKALWEAYKSLCADEPEMRGRVGGINYTAGSAINYDASNAYIETN